MARKTSPLWTLPIWKQAKTGNTFRKKGIQGKRHPSEMDETLTATLLFSNKILSFKNKWMGAGGSHSCLIWKHLSVSLQKFPSQGRGRINTYRTKQALERQQYPRVRSHLKEVLPVKEATMNLRPVRVRSQKLIWEFATLKRSKWGRSERWQMGWGEGRSYTQTAVVLIKPQQLSSMETGVLSIWVTEKQLW